MRKKIVSYFARILSTRPDPDVNRQAAALIEDMDVVLDAEIDPAMRRKLETVAARVLSRNPEGAVTDVAEQLANKMEDMLAAELGAPASTARPASSELTALPTSPAVEPVAERRAFSDVIEFEPPGKAPVAGPSDQEDPKNLIVLPGTKEFRETTSPARVEVPAIRLRPSAAGQAQLALERPQWDLADLNRVLHQRTPPILTIQVHNRENQPIQITLQRNIINAPFSNPAGAVKVLYKAEAAGDDLCALATFFTDQLEIDIGKAMRQIEEQAVKLYSPRPRELASSTPARVGPMTFRPDDPHEETDRLKQNIAGAGVREF